MNMNIVKGANGDGGKAFRGHPKNARKILKIRFDPFLFVLATVPMFGIAVFFLTL